MEADMSWRQFTMFWAAHGGADKGIMSSVMKCYDLNGDNAVDLRDAGRMMR